MNFKTTYIFFGILIALLGVAAFTLLTGPKPGSEGLLLANLKSADVTADKVTRVTVERTQPAETKLVFARDGKQWKLEKPYRRSSTVSRSTASSATSSTPAPRRKAPT